MNTIDINQKKTSKKEKEIIRNRKNKKTGFDLAKLVKKELPDMISSVRQSFLCVPVAKRNDALDSFIEVKLHIK